MAHVVYLPEAREDLFEIWRFIATGSGSPDIADNFIDVVDDTCGIYASQPDMGQTRPELASGVRSFPVGKYVVFYLPTEEGIEVVQVIHGARDIPVVFRRPREHGRSNPG